MKGNSPIRTSLAMLCMYVFCTGSGVGSGGPHNAAALLRHFVGTTKDIAGTVLSIFKAVKEQPAAAVSITLYQA